jgi:hypothetical protein
MPPQATSSWVGVAAGTVIGPGIAFVASGAANALINKVGTWPGW